MRRDRPDWFPLYVADFMTDEKVQAMTIDQVGAYILLLCSEWVNGSIPADLPALARILKQTPSGMEILWLGLAPCFSPGEPGRLLNPRMERERSGVVRRVDAARKGADARWRNATAPKPQCDRIKTAIRETAIAHAPYVYVSVDSNSLREADFDELWQAYHQKGRVKRPLSQQYYSEHVRTREEHARVMSALLGKWAKCEKWAKGYVLSLPEWISQECWKEDPEPASADAPVRVAPVYHPPSIPLEIK